MTTAPLDADLLEAVTAFAAERRAGHPVLVASDFDGVLAPLVDDPSASRTTEPAQAALDRLATAPDDQVRLALVSGRTVDALAALAHAPSGTVLVGSHGAERGEVLPAAGEGPRPVHRLPFALSEAEATLLEQVRTGLEALAREVEGAWVEHKPSAAVLHTRLSEPGAGARAAEAAHALGEGLGAFSMRGKDVVEIAVVAVSKGQALTALSDELGAAAVFYMGDDVTDERAFDMLSARDLTVRVGPGATTARFRVAGPGEAAAVLAALADALVTPVPRASHE